MDPMTQSAQISSSQGFADGQNSAAKESKLSDSFLSSSPVSLIQSPQDKREVLGSDKPCEGVATSLRFPSQPGSFSPDHYGSDAGPPDGQPDSPIKTSPVSERIKALEALAAKKKEPDFRSEGGFSHFRDRHHEKSPSETHKPPSETQKLPTEKNTPVVQSKPDSPEESPESPFEVLGDLRQVHEFEETEEWMKAHLPPVPDLDAVELIKGTVSTENVIMKEEKEPVIDIPAAPAAFAGVPDAFMDSPVEAPILKDEFTSDPQKQPSVEEESEFDLNFLPTAYMWDQQERSSGQIPASLDSVHQASPAPPAGFDSPSPPVSPGFGNDAKQNVLDEKKTAWTGDLEPPETSEVDSSGDSDDTVIEDGVTVAASVPPPVSDPEALNDPTTTPAPSAPVLPAEQKETPPARTERKLMTVPTINVIETDEPNYSDEEMELEAEEEEDYEVVKESSKDSEPEPEDNRNEPPKTRPLETEFMEGYSPPSSPVDSDAEYSPKHKILKSDPETVDQESASKPEDSGSDNSQAKPEKSQSVASPFTIPNEEDFPDNDDEWSDEPCKTDLTAQEPAQYIHNTESTTLPKTSFMQDDIYDRQSFDYDYDASSPFEDIDEKGIKHPKEHFIYDSSQTRVESPNPNIVPEDGSDGRCASVNDDKPCSKLLTQQSLTEYPKDPYSSFQSEPQSSVEETDLCIKTTTDIISGNFLPVHKTGSNLEQDSKAGPRASDSSSPEASEPTDSFVEFMRECLKSREDEEPDTQGIPSKDEFSKIGVQFPPKMVMDLEQEQLTISALKELGSSQEEEEEEEMALKTKVPKQEKADHRSTQQSSCASVTNVPCPQSELVFDSTYSKEVEAIDVWVAEAYHLAEHVLTAILTHLSVKDLIHWRDPKKSGVVFGVSLLLLLSLAAFSVISVISYLLLALLCVTITFRIYKSVVQAVQKSSDGHPFKAMIDKDVSIPPETFRKHVDASLTYINRALKQMSRLFLVEDLVDSLKLAVVMWLLTYVGAVFNGITILILADILLFAVPPIYEKNKTQIDQYIDLARTQINTTIAKLQEKLPGAVKRSKTE